MVTYNGTVLFTLTAFGGLCGVNHAIHFTHQRLCEALQPATPNMHHHMPPVMQLTCPSSREQQLAPYGSMKPERKADLGWFHPRDTGTSQTPTHHADHAAQCS